MQNFKFSEEDNEHINKMPFSGTVVFTDTPSDGAPCGSGGKSIVISANAAEQAKDSLIGMGVNCMWGDDWFCSPANALTRHNERFKIGVIESVEIIGNEVQVQGFLWKYDFDDVCKMIKHAKDSLGFSVEIVSMGCEETDEVVILNKITFTGLAILYYDCAAFEGTRLIAQRSDVGMNEQQIKEIVEQAVSAVEVKFAEELAKANETIQSLTEKLALSANVSENEEIVAIKAANETLSASNTDLQEKINTITAEIDEMKKPKGVRKSEQYTSLSKYGEDKALGDVCKEISDDMSLSVTDKWALKLQAWQKERSN